MRIVSCFDKIYAVQNESMCQVWSLLNALATTNFYSGLGSGEPTFVMGRGRAEELNRSEAILREGEERFRFVADTALIWQSGTDQLCTNDSTKTL